MFAVVIEDQTLMRDYLQRVVQEHLGATRVVGIGSLEELERRSAEFEGARLIMFDVDLGDGSSVDWAVRWATAHPGLRMVALSSIQGSMPYKRLQSAGISLVHKNDNQQDLVATLRMVLGGAMMVSPKIQELLAAGGRDPHSPTKLLSQKEIRVLALLGQRMRNDEIAGVLGLSAVTVGDHRKKIMQKLGLHHIEEVIEYAIRHGVVFVPPKDE